MNSLYIESVIWSFVVLFCGFICCVFIVINHINNHSGIQDNNWFAGPSSGGEDTDNALCRRNQLWLRLHRVQTTSKYAEETIHQDASSGHGRVA
jgi:hypothetical protein